MMDTVEDRLEKISDRLESLIDTEANFYFNLGFFRFGHLNSQKSMIVSATFANAACDIVELLPSSAERTVALRKLVEAKDAAVRALVFS